MAINGNRLEEIREKRRVPSNVLAQAVSVSPSLITIAEGKDAHEFKASTANGLCRYLDCSYEYLSNIEHYPAPYVYARKAKESQDHFDVVDINGKVVSHFFLSNVHAIKPINAGIPVAGDTTNGPDDAYVLSKYPNDYGQEFIDMPSDGSMYVLRISSVTDTNLGRTGDGLLVSHNSGADTGDDVIFKMAGVWKIATILLSRHGTLTLEVAGNREVVNAFDIELIHRICGSVTTSMFRPR